MHKMAPATGLAPNNSFKPNLLRYTKAMAEKACHGFGSTTQVGLTQALGRRVNCMGKFLSRSVAFRLSLGLLMSFGAAQLRDFLALRLPSHQSLADRIIGLALVLALGIRSEEHTSELQSLMRISYAVFCLKQNTHTIIYAHNNNHQQP